MSNNSKLTTEFAKKAIEELATIKCSAPNYYRAVGERIREYMDKCIKNSMSGSYAQNIDGIYELVKSNCSQKTLMNFCVRALYSGKVNNSTIYAEEITTLGVERLTEFVSMRNNLANTARKLVDDLATDTSYNEALKLINSSSGHMRDMMESIIEEREVKIDFANKQLNNHNGEMYDVLFGTATPEDKQKQRFEKFLDKYCPTSDMRK